MMADSYKRMMGSAALWCLVLWQAANCEVQQMVECQQLTSPCLFQCRGQSGNDSWWLDLTSLQPETEMQPVFKDVLDKNGEYQYSYSPCTAYNQGLGCSTGTSVCQADPLDPQQTNDVGDMSTAILNYDPSSGHASLTYRKPLTGKLTKVTQVNLLCEENEKRNQLKVEGEVITDNYVMNLTGPAACLSTSSPTTQPPTSTAHNPTTESAHSTTEPRDVTTTEPRDVTTTEPRDVTTSQGNSTHATTHGHDVTTQGDSTPADVTTSETVTTHHTTASTTGETTSNEVVTTASHGTDVTTGGSSSTRHPTSTASCRLGLPVLFLLLTAKLALSIV